MTKMLEGYVVTDRRGQDHGELTLPRGVREEIRRIQGCDVACRVYDDGRVIMDRIVNAAPENLEHRFETCNAERGGCGESHLIVGDATFDPALDCPRSPGNGWTWTMGYGPGYGPSGRDDRLRTLDPGGLTTRTNNLNMLAREMQRRGFDVD